MEQTLPASLLALPADDKLAAMDERISAITEKASGETICSIVFDVFGIDYRKVPVLHNEIAPLVKENPTASAAAIELYIDRHGVRANGPEIRGMMNQLFGTNLEGIAALSQTRICLFSKNQWIAKKDKDLFAIHTGHEDVDVKIIPTRYFTEKTGCATLPEPLIQRLCLMGYRYNEDISAYYYRNPEGVSVPDAFKGKTIGSIIEVTKEHFSHL